MTQEEYKEFKSVAKWATRRTVGPAKEDQEQEVILLLWRNRSRVRPDATAAERLMFYRTTARNCVISSYRRESRQRGDEPYAKSKARENAQGTEPYVSPLPERQPEKLSFEMSGIHDLGEFLENLYEIIQKRVRADVFDAKVLSDVAAARGGATSSRDHDFYDGKTRASLCRESARLAEELGPEFESTMRRLTPQRLVDLLSVSPGWMSAE